MIQICVYDVEFVELILKILTVHLINSLVLLAVLIL